MKKTSKITTVHFTVDPDGITRLIRDMWAEGSFDKAFNVLGSISADAKIPTEIQYDILRGKKKFALFKNDPDKFCIVADDWKPRHGDYYPDPEPSKLAAFLKKQSKEQTDYEIALAMRGMELPDEDSAEELTDLPSVKFQGNRIDTIKLKMFAGFKSLQEMNETLLIQRNLPTTEDVLAAMHSRDERDGKRPRPDHSLASEMGWLMPDGKFYACLSKMEHVWLAGQFGKTEKQAEDLGWMKITKGLMGETVIQQLKNDPTQKQLDTLFDWCEKHNAKLPEWAGGKE